MDPKRILQCFDRIENILRTAAASLLVAVMIAVCMDVVLRYGFNNPLSGVTDLVEYALVYITFLGAAWVLRVDGHVRIDIVLSALSPRWQLRLHVACCVLGAVVSAVLTVFGVLVTWRYYVHGFYKATVLELPTWIVLVVVPCGSFLLCFRFMRKMFEYCRQMKSADGV